MDETEFQAGPPPEPGRQGESASEPFGGTLRFLPLRRLGAGGMGVVYEVFDREREERVALKTVRRLDPRNLYYFKQEFRSLADLTHPNLVSLYELISEGDRWFFTMDLIEGGVDILSFLRATPAPFGPGGDLAPTVEARAVAPTEMAPTATRAGLLVSGDTSSPGSSQFATISAGDFAPGSTVGGTEASFLAPRAEPDVLGPTPLIDPGRLREAFRQLAEGVLALHRAGKMHRDLKPGNVMARLDGRILLLDFGLIAELDQGQRSRRVEPPGPGGSGDSTGSSDEHRVVGTIHYMAPEQAAGWPPEPPCDWYSLGVMLFEAITGRVPFAGPGARVLRDKQRLDAPDPGPEARLAFGDLVDLAMELLSRDPTARPKGAQVLARLGGPGAVPSSPATVPERELAPFIGRGGDLAAIDQAFAEARAGATVVVRLHGRSGAGKSALVRQFLDDLSARDEAVILSGRCYEQESVPYKAVDSLIDDLTRHLLRLGTEEVAALIPAGIGALARIFPVLRRIEAIAEAPEGPEGLDLQATRRRAFAVFCDILSRLAVRRPLVLAIDDLQWGDIDSAAILATLLGPPAPRPLLVLFAYRSEDAETSPCLRALGAAPPESVIVRERAIEPLTLAESVELALALLGDRGGSARARAGRIAEQAGGNPYFISELTRHLPEGAVRSGGSDLDEILWGRVQALPESARTLLEVVAVAGSPIRLRLAGEAAGLAAIPAALVALLRSSQLIRGTGPGLDDEIETYHDRVRESIASRLGAETRVARHAGLATVLEGAGALPEAVAPHLKGAGRLVEAGRTFELAADQAVRVLAFDRAEDFYLQAAGLLGETERARIDEKRIHFTTDLARFADAYAIARRAVRPFGVSLPARFFPPMFFVDYLIARFRLKGRRASDLVALPPMTDVRLATAVRLMAAATKAAYQIRPELCVSVATRIVNLCLSRGNSPESAIGYVVFGSIFRGGVLGDYRAGHDYGRLGLDLVESYANDQQRAEVQFVVGYFGTSWLRPASESEDLFRAAHASGLATGDLFHTGCASAGLAISQFVRGVPLDRVWDETGPELDLLRRFGLREPLGVVVTIRQAIRNLRGETRSPGSWDADDFDEAEHAHHCASFGSRHFAHVYPVAKALTLALREAWDEALGLVESASGYLRDSPGLLHGAEHRFLRALARAALSKTAAPRPARSRAIRHIEADHRRLRHWADLGPANYLSRERLVAAEVARISGKDAEAVALYAAAIDAADRSGHASIAALAHASAGRYHRDRGDLDRAGAHRAAASVVLRAWGASALVADAASPGARQA